MSWAHILSISLSPSVRSHSRAFHAKAETWIQKTARKVDRKKKEIVNTDKPAIARKPGESDQELIKRCKEHGLNLWRELYIVWGGNPAKAQQITNTAYLMAFITYRKNTALKQTWRVTGISREEHLRQQIEEELQRLEKKDYKREQLLGKKKPLPELGRGHLYTLLSSLRHYEQNLEQAQGLGIANPDNRSAEGLRQAVNKAEKK